MTLSTHSLGPSPSVGSVLSLGMVVFLVLCVPLLSAVLVSAESCGYKGCHPVKSSVLNIHLVAHTHDDVGWLKTVDQYYYGSNKGHSPNGVQYIIDSVVSELLKNKDRRFVYVESSFLWRWWREQDPDNQELVQRLVQEGRLQLLHGGWCMSDEATPHYSAMIDQMTLGLKFLNETFGECGVPRVAWQIDPFGHSSEAALEFADMGYDGLFFGRIDHEDLTNRKYLQEMETVWRPDTRTGEAGELFSGVLYNLYMPPNGFCFDTYCNDEPIMDNPKLHGYNVNERVTQFVNEVQVWAEAYKTNHVMVTMGGDFTYIVASAWFKNMDKLIKYVNRKYNDVNVLYSTPACYLKALHDENITWPVKDNDDFFPYGSDDHSYWTGYFTSRPNFKYMVYRGNNLLQAAKQLRLPLGTDLEEEQYLMARGIAISQHHDAVSGTEKQHVADDYALYIHEGIDACQKIFTTTYRKWLGTDLPEQTFCRVTNISQCEVSEYSSRFVVTLYNPLARPTSIPVLIPVTPGTYTVTGPSGSEIQSELVPVPEPVKDIPGRQGNTTLELLFIAEDIPALGLVSFHVDKTEGGSVPIATQVNLTLKSNTTNVTLPVETSQEIPELEDIIVDNGVFKLKFNSSNGFLHAIEREGEMWSFQQNFYYYEASKGYNYNSFNRASGAYIFRPSSEEALAISNYANISIFKGKKVIEVHQTFTNWVSQIIRLHQGQDQIEFQWLVGPIPVEQWIGKEIITRYKTQLITNSTWYTDSNGRRLMKRVRNHRDSWNLTLTEPIASNYYPLTSAAVILGNKHRLTVLTDRPQGAASLQDGELEIMLHRRLLYDDNKGVSEPLDEIQFRTGLVARGTHILQFSKTFKSNDTYDYTTETNTNGRYERYKYKEGAEKHRFEAQKLVMGPWLSFASTDLSASEWNRKYKTKFEGLLREPLPENIHLLTLERWDGDSLLVRLEHIFEAHEHPTLSKDVNVPLKTLFADYDVVDAVELSLGANQKKSQVQRLHWKHDGRTVQTHSHPLTTDLLVNLQPMDIKTFQLFITPRRSS